MGYHRAMIVDTHCHLDASYFPEGPDAVLARARAAGVGAFVCVGVSSLEAARQAVSLAERRADVVATLGVHPHDASTLDDALYAELARLARHERVAAVGEAGLDYHYDHSPRDVQREVFARFVALARAVNKPLVVHTRSAPADTLDILESEGARDAGGVIHCFSEDRAFAARAFALGFDVSFSGIVTFKNATAVRDVAAWAPLDKILVETDSPYLAPVPLRGKPCEPAYVVHTARVVAELRQMAPGALAEATTKNAFSRFGPALAAAADAVQNESG
jgi:TatD DNase family protein